ncbi:Serine/threonine protein kinase [Nannocystis exedens]|uniref:Serine/threonine protein kinase n=1 Tax=Nannocystis exedens TaxID=54 RepID=A0A1I2DDK2_9BACT|nr:serine/threonine-protein kinase [Nannocystis exedens]PCC70573.1 serine/threonine protein kinase [Nannocystis exedens]SFE78587.1 Serine/threonine protein kinase [Nannocystis exedens]
MTEDVHPAKIGPFVVTRKLGEGSMGIVYAAQDASLAREVALKVLSRRHFDNRQVRARMVREAQALARLSHPDVVQVYQVGEHDDEIYVAMEYVHGQTLKSWLRAGKRPWQLVLRTSIGAGRGLAVAHAAGLVHRDFKPDNVLVGDDTRARVVDFGLVHADGQVLASSPDESSPQEIEAMSLSQASTRLQPVDEPQGMLLGDRLTRTGMIVGTPTYMSPEQHFFGVIGPASDQFSFGVTLYEALYGVRPFLAASWEELRLKVRRGIVPPPPRDSPVPKRVFRIIARSLAPTPDLRWPSLEQMLEALERDPRKTALRAAGIIAVAGAAATGSYAIAVSQREASQPCTDLAAELVGVWDGARATAAEQAFTATGSPFAVDTWRRVDARLDAYALAWTESRTDACEAHASGSQSTTLFDRRTACLARRRAHLSALVDVFIAADRSVIENAVQATAALPSLESCADADALLAAVAPPDDPHTAAEVETRRSQLARAATLEGTGHDAEGLQLAREVRAAAEELRYPPLAAEAALGEGSLLMAVARAEEAEAALTAALKLALVHGLDAVAAEAAARRVFALGEGLGQRVAALAGEAVAEALIERTRDDGRIAALLHNNLGAVYELDGATARAREHYLQTIELLGRRTGASDPLLAAVHHNLAGLLRREGRLDASREAYSQAVALFSELLGEQHPMGAHPLGGVADIDLLQGRRDAAAAAYRRQLALMEATYGPHHLYLLHPLVGLGKVGLAIGDLDTATAEFRRAVAIGEQLGTTHSMYAEALAGLAECFAATDVAEARGLLARAIATYEADGGPTNPAIAPLAVRAGELAVAANDLPAARQWFERVLADATGSKEQLDSRSLAALGLARLLLAAGERQRACSLLPEARGVPGDAPRPDLDALEAACARGGDRPRLRIGARSGRPRCLRPQRASPSRCLRPQRAYARSARARVVLAAYARCGHEPRRAGFSTATARSPSRSPSSRSHSAEPLASRADARTRALCRVRRPAARRRGDGAGGRARGSRAAGSAWRGGWGVHAIQNSGNFSRAMEPAELARNFFHRGHTSTLAPFSAASAAPAHSSDRSPSCSVP